MRFYSTTLAFAALKADGSITAWGNSDKGGTGAPSDNGYTKIYSTRGAFVALKADGSPILEEPLPFSQLSDKSH
jgi:hypothetical protein